MFSKFTQLFTVVCLGIAFVFWQQPVQAVSSSSMYHSLNGRLDQCALDGNYPSNSAITSAVRDWTASGDTDVIVEWLHLQENGLSTRLGLEVFPVVLGEGARETITYDASFVGTVQVKFYTNTQNGYRLLASDQYQVGGEPSGLRFVQCEGITPDYRGDNRYIVAPFTVEIGPKNIRHPWGTPLTGLDSCVGPFDDGRPVQRHLVQLIITNQDDRALLMEGEWLRPPFLTRSGRLGALCYYDYLPDQNVSAGETVDVTFFTHISPDDVIRTITLDLYGSRAAVNIPIGTPE